MSNTIQLRLATIQDAKLLLKWRNDTDTRMASHSTDKILLDDHLTWLKRTLGDSNRQLFIAEENKIPVATVRADFFSGEWELSWTVAPNERGRGIAKQSVALLAKKISQPIRAEIKSENIASIEIAKYVGMEFDREVEGVSHYRRSAIL